MKASIARKSIVVGIMVVFIGASVVSGLTATSNYNPMNRANWLYVGGSGSGNYSSIQKAIDNSTNGDTIFVYNKTYNENINTKQKKITLIGEDRDITTIQGQGTDSTVKIGTSEVNITGFTIMGVTTDSGVIEVASITNTILINHNLIKNGAYGIKLPLTTSKITITDNIFSDQIFAGIFGESSSYDVIRGNRIENSGGQGIHLSISSNHNSILNNTIVNSVSEAIFLEGLTSTVNTISGNNLSNNKVGIRFTSAGTNTITNNNIQGSTMEGVLIKTSNDNVIVMNNFINNKRQAKFQFSSRDTWDANYWSNWIGFTLKQPLFQKFPKPITGVMKIYFDWHPAKQPYNFTI
jgi:nitrous oxidase accessory protein